MRRGMRHQAATMIAHDLPKYLQLKKNPWWQLFHHVRPLLNVARAENRIAELDLELSTVRLEHSDLKVRLDTELQDARALIDTLQSECKELRHGALQLELAMADASEAKQSLIERNAGLETELTMAKDRARQELEPMIETLQIQIKAGNAQKVQVEEQMGNLWIENDGLKTKLEDLEFEKMRLSMQERVLVTKLTELEHGNEMLRSNLLHEQTIKQGTEEQIVQLRCKNEEIEAKLVKTCEELVKTDASLKELQAASETKIVALRSDLEQLQRRHGREMQQMNDELQAERRDTESLRIKVRDSKIAQEQLTEQVEEERRIQVQARREKERLDMRIHELERSMGEAVQTHGLLHVQLKSEQEKGRLLECKLQDAEDAIFQADRQKKSLEARISDATTQIDTLRTELLALNSKLQSLKEHFDQQTHNLHCTQDELALTAERLQLTQQQRLLMEAELKDEQAMVMQLQDDKRTLERLLRETSAILTDLQAKSNNSTSDAIAPGFHLTQALECIARESEERSSTISSLKRQLLDLDREKTALQEQLLNTRKPTSMLQ